MIHFRSPAHSKPGGPTTKYFSSRTKRKFLRPLQLEIMQQQCVLLSKNLTKRFALEPTHDSNSKGTIYLPTSTAPAKLDYLKSMIGDSTEISVVVSGSDCLEAELEARNAAQKTGGIFISPYNDLDVVAGQVILILSRDDSFNTSRAPLVLKFIPNGIRNMGVR